MHKIRDLSVLLWLGKQSYDCFSESILNDMGKDNDYQTITGHKKAWAPYPCDVLYVCLCGDQAPVSI